MTQEIDVCVAGEKFNAIEILSVIIGVISLNITIIIGYYTIPQLSSLPKLDIAFKYLFYISWISSIIQILSTILSTILCFYSLKITSIIMVTIAVYFYYILLLSLLATLLTRLYFAFIESVYKLTKNLQNILIICFIIVIILMIGNIISDMISFFDKIIFDHNLHLASIFAMIFGSSCIFAYVLTASFSMAVFTNNLIKLTHLNATTPPHILPINSLQSPVVSNDDDSGSRSSSFFIPTPKYILNERQIELIENISKYVSLLSLAILSSLIVAIAILCGIWIKDITFRTHFFQIILIFASVDSVINLICLYLQYSFALNKYKKYCRCIYFWCKIMLKYQTTKSGRKMYRESIAAMRDNKPSIIHKNEIQPLSPNTANNIKQQSNKKYNNNNIEQEEHEIIYNDKI